MNKLMGMECDICKNERQRRCIVVSETDIASKALSKEPWLSALAVYANNVPRFHSLLLRSRTWAVQNGMQCVWAYAYDVPLHSADRDLPADQLQKKRSRWLQIHDQSSAHLAGILLLAKEIPMRLLDTVSRKLQLYKGRRGALWGWSLCFVVFSFVDRTVI